MSCENTERNNKEWYIKDFRKAILLKFKSATSPSPDIKTETIQTTYTSHSMTSPYMLVKLNSPPTNRWNYPP